MPSETVEEKPKKVIKAKPFLRWVTAAQVPDTNPQEALDALRKLADGKVYKIAIWHHQGRFDITREEVAASAVQAIDEKEAKTADIDCSQFLAAKDAVKDQF